MRTADWVRRLTGLPAIQNTLLDTPRSCEWQSIAYEARPVLLAAAFCAKPRKILVVTASYDRALAWQAKLTLGGVNPELICQLHSGQSQLFEDASPEQIALSDRLGALRALAGDEAKIVLASPGAVLERTLPTRR